MAVRSSIWDEGCIESKLEARKAAILSGWVIDSTWMTTFAGAMAEADVVTFDVFDTAITRSVEAPVDVFALAEQALCERFGSIFIGFAQKREQAEKQSRIEVRKARDCSEVTLAEILDALVRMSPAYVPFRSAINDTEIAMERAACFGVPEILAAVQSCLEAGRRVVFVSDMYHDSQFIRTLLTDAGFTDGIDVLVSSETRCSKAEGTQWAVVAEHIGVRPGRILHVGDDGRSDVDSPRAKGLKTLAFTKALSNKRRGGPLTPAVMPFSYIARRAQLWRAQDNAQADRAATMRVLGQSWGAVVVGAHIRWVAERAKAIGVDRLFFCARDGWLVQRARFPPICMLFRRSAIAEIGPLNAAMPVLGDWDFNIRLMRLGDIGFIPETLANYHHRVAGTNSAYSNTVVEGRATHEYQNRVFRNALLRESLQAHPELTGVVQAVMMEVDERHQQLVDLLRSQDSKLNDIGLVASWHRKMLRPLHWFWLRLLPVRRLIERTRGRA